MASSSMYGGGMPKVDFGTLGSLGTVYKEAQNERTLADLGQLLADGTIDYKQAAGMAAKAGRIDVGMSLLKLGEEKAQSASFNTQFGNILGGGGQPVAPPPVAPQSSVVPPQAGPAVGSTEPIVPKAVTTQSMPPVRQAMDGIISAVTPDGRNIAPEINAAGEAVAARQRLAQGEGTQPAAPAAPVASAVPGMSQNPASGKVQQLMTLLAHPGVKADQKKGIELALQRELDNSKLTDEQKEYVWHRAQGGRETFTEWKTNLKRAGATMINTAEGLEGAQTKARIAIDTETAKEAAKLAAAGSRVGPLLDQVISLADKTPGGWAGPVAATMAKAFSAVGFQVTEGMSNAELLGSISQRLVPIVREPGPTSEKEIVLYLNAVPGLMQSQEGRVKVAQMTKEIVARSIEVARVYRENLGSPDLYDKLAKLDKPLFSPESRKTLEGATPSSKGGPSRSDIENELRRRGKL